MIFSGVNEVAAGGVRGLQPNRVICKIDTFVISHARAAWSYTNHITINCITEFDFPLE